MAYKNPLTQADDLFALNRENRKNTLNKRINLKGNNELRITGGSNALDNQSIITDRNNVANTMTIADPNGIGADWTLPSIKKDLEGLNNRYENRNGHDIYYSPKTKRGRRLLDTQRYNRAYRNPQSLADQLVQDQIVEKINEYEGVGGK